MVIIICDKKKIMDTDMKKSSYKLSENNRNCKRGADL